MVAFDLAAARAIDRSTPFWHRDRPVLSAVRIDEEFAGLRHAFPVSWQQLVQVKALLDSHAMLSSVAAEREQDGLKRELAARAAGLMAAAARAERSIGRHGLADRLSGTADRLDVQARAGRWPPFVVQPPPPDEPWVYCGPLGTWAARAMTTPLSLLVTTPDPSRQAAIRATDDRYATVQAAVDDALGEHAATVADRPDMYASTLVLAGGESAFGHKNFAHFVPLETPGGTTAGPKFTVVFANVHAERVRLCSLVLLDAFVGAASVADVPLEDVVSASLVWFRCHDFGHFWRREKTAAGPVAAVSAFERISLEECYSDLLGLLAAIRIADQRALNVAFGAELLRYLSRRLSYFGDSVAAALTVGWLAWRGVRVPAASPDWLDEHKPAMVALVRAIHAVLWEGCDEPVGELRLALAAGQAVLDGLEPLFAAHPTDLTYVFG